MRDNWLAQIGARIKQFRDRKGMSQDALAARAGIKSGSTIHNLEVGKVENPGVNTLRSIADALDIPRSMLGVATEEDLPSIDKEAQHFLHLLSLLPEDRAAWYLETMASEAEKIQRSKRQ